MIDRRVEELLIDNLRPVTAPMALWNGIEANLTARPAPRRHTAWAVAATVFVAMSASALWFLQAAPRRSSDPSVVEQFRTSRPLICSNCHV